MCVNVGLILIDFICPTGTLTFLISFFSALTSLFLPPTPPPAPKPLMRVTALRVWQQLSLGEEFLLLMILIVTEMPWLPDPVEEDDANGSGDVAPELEPEPKPESAGDLPSGALKLGPTQPTPYKPGNVAAGGRSRSLRVDSRVGRQLRRELVHRLASSPCPHSELQDTYYATSQTETIDSEVRGSGYCWNIA